MPPIAKVKHSHATHIMDMLRLSFSVLTAWGVPDIGLEEVVECYNKHVHKTKKQIEEIWNYDQRTEGWYDARYWITTSSAKMDVAEKLWRLFQGNVATRWGTEMEPTAEKGYLEWRRANGFEEVEIVHRGLVICEDMPWIGGSPDGEIPSESRLIEYKCPYSKRFQTDGYDMSKYGKIPVDYYKQIQLNMHILGHKQAHFVVWSPTNIWVEQFEYDPVWVSEYLEKVTKFYFEQLFPALICKSKGLLIEPNVVYIPEINKEQIAKARKELEITTAYRNLEAKRLLAECRSGGGGGAGAGSDFKIMTDEDADTETYIRLMMENPDAAEAVSGAKRKRMEAAASKTKERLKADYTIQAEDDEEPAWMKEYKASQK